MHLHTPHNQIGSIFHPIVLVTPNHTVKIILAGYISGSVLKAKEITRGRTLAGNRGVACLAPFKGQVFSSLA